MSGQFDEEVEISKDPAYKAYTGKVAKVLKRFEKTSEWEDLISHLTSLNKLLLSNTKYSTIPNRITIGKRLAQCLHPALPSGVHLKALETYDIILHRIGTLRLSSDLFTWSSGLFPLFGHCSMSVKLPLLNLYESHYLPLGDNLRPGLGGLLISLFSGLEDGSEHFNRCYLLLDAFRKSTGSEFYYGCLWECAGLCPNIRLQAINYVLCRYNKKYSMEDQLDIMGTNIDQMVGALGSCFQDNSVLVQRAALEFMLVGFPLHNSQLTRHDMQLMVESALSVLLRRDISLNRRLYAWFLGHDISGSPLESSIEDGSSTLLFKQKDEEVSTDLRYFDAHSRTLLTQALLKMFRSDSYVLPGANIFQPFKILIHLLDKPEIGGEVIDDVLVDVLKRLYKEYSVFEFRENNCAGSDKKPLRNHSKGQVTDESEIIKMTNLLFGSLEPQYLWQYLSRQFDKCCSNANVVDSSVSLLDYTSLIIFLLNKLSLESYLETQTTLLPELLLSVSNTMKQNLSFLSNEEICMCFQLCEKILTRIMPCPSNKDAKRSMESIASSSLEESGRNVLCNSPASAETPSPSVVDLCRQSFTLIFENFASVRVADDVQYDDVADDDIFLNLIRVDASECDAASEECVVSETTIEAYQCASKLLLSYSSFPVCVDAPQPSVTTKLERSDAHIPMWLRYILVAACRTRNFAIHSCAVSLLVDLIQLTKSTRGISSREDLKSNGDTVSIVFDPLLSHDHLLYLNRRVYIYESIARRLWTYMSACFPDMHERAALLMCKLHAVAPFSSICENVLASNMLHEDVDKRRDACERFSVMWQLLHDSSQSIRPQLYKALFIMFDHLQNNDGICHSVAQMWAAQTIQHLNTPSLLEPLLLLMLNPDTARVSIQHMKHETKRQSVTEKGDDGDNIDMKISAISHENGNIVYHVNDHLQHSLSKFVVDELRTFALTTVVGRQSYTEAVDANMDTDYHFNNVNPRHVNIRTNPFGSMSSVEDEYAGQVTAGAASIHRPNEGFDFTVRLSAAIGQREGNQSLYSNYMNTTLVEEEHEEVSSVVEPDSESDVDHVSEVVRILLGEIVDLVVQQHELEKRSISESGTLQELDKISDACFSDFVTDDISSAEGRTTSEELQATVSSDNQWYKPEAANGVHYPGRRTTSSDEVLNNKHATAYDVHPLHAHILLYKQKYDSNLVLYGLGRFYALLQDSQRLLACACATQNLGSTSTPHAARIHELLIRHRRSIFGQNFFSNIPQDSAGNYKSTTYLEIIVSICLYYMRSYFYEKLIDALSVEEIVVNSRVQLMSCEILCLLLSENILIARESGKGFASYLSDLLSRCKLQKSLLHCVLAGSQKQQKQRSSHFVRQFYVDSSNESLQFHYLRLLVVVITLEDVIGRLLNNFDPPTDWYRSNTAAAKFVGGRPIVYQVMFLTGIVTSLRQSCLAFVHAQWIALILSALPYMGRAISKIVHAVIIQLCKNIEKVALICLSELETSQEINFFPPGYAVVLLEALSTLCQYCLLESNQAVGVARNAALNVLNLPSEGEKLNSPAFFSSLKQVFKMSTANKESDAKESSLSPIAEARRYIVSIFPRVIAAVTALWKSVNLFEESTESTRNERFSWVFGTPKTLRTTIIEFLSPLSVHYGLNLLGAVAIVWNDIQPAAVTSLTVLPTLYAVISHKSLVPDSTDDQKLLVQILAAVRVLPLDTLIQLVKQILKSPPSIEKTARPFEVSVLHFFSVYMHNTKATVLYEARQNLLSLFSESLALNLPTAAQLLLLHTMLVLAKDIFVLLFNILAATCRATFRFFCPVRKDLSGQVAVITGAGRGIGRELAREFCAKGCDLALVDMDAEALAETKNTIHTSNTVTTYTCDITSSENVQRVAAEVLKEHGRADILVNNAGIINIKDILSLTSMAAKSGTALLTDYTMSKFGAFGFTEALAAELQEHFHADKVLTTTVCPLFVNTQMVHKSHAPYKSRFGRLLEPQEIAEAVVDAVRRNAREIYIPGPMGFLSDFLRVFVPKEVAIYLRKFIDAGFDMRKNN